MKVYVFPADEQGCGYYRMIWPAKALAHEGHDVVVVPPSQQKARFQAKMIGHRMVGLSYPKDADVIVMQRITHRYLIQAIEIMRRDGVAVVIDMDDDLTCIDPRNPAWRFLHPANKGDHNWQNATLACEAATYVTVSTPALLETYVKHGRGQVLHNYVPNLFTQIVHNDNLSVGWAGAIHSHPGDLDDTRAALNRLVQEKHDVRIVGAGEGLADVLGKKLASQIPATGAVEQRDWPLQVTTLGVGIAPLAATKFNTAKSWLKPLEYAALGMPSVVSARAEYERLHADHGIGNVARSGSQWYKILKDLVTNDERRIFEGARDRERVREHLTIEGNAWRWAEAWQNAARLRTKSALGILTPS